MTTTSRTRLALAAAAAWSAVFLLDLLSDHDPESGLALDGAADFAHEWAFAATSLLTAVALWVLAVGATRGATVALRAAAVGHILFGIVATSTAIAGEETLDGPFVLGLFLVLVGYIVAAGLDVRKGIAPARIGIVLCVGFVVNVVLDNLGLGGVTIAASWMAVAHLLRDAQERVPMSTAT